MPFAARLWPPIEWRAALAMNGRFAARASANVVEDRAAAWRDGGWKPGAGIVGRPALPADDHAQPRRRAEEQGAPRQSADFHARALWWIKVAVRIQ